MTPPQPPPPSAGRDPGPAHTTESRTLESLQVAGEPGRASTSRERNALQVCCAPPSAPTLWSPGRRRPPWDTGPSTSQAASGKWGAADTAHGGRGAPQTPSWQHMKPPACREAATAGTALGSASVWAQPRKYLSLSRLRAVPRSLWEAQVTEPIWHPLCPPASLQPSGAPRADPHPRPPPPAPPAAHRHFKGVAATTGSWFPAGPLPQEDMAARSVSSPPPLQPPRSPGHSTAGSWGWGSPAGRAHPRAVSSKQPLPSFNPSLPPSFLPAFLPSSGVLPTEAGRPQRGLCLLAGGFVGKHPQCTRRSDVEKEDWTLFWAQEVTGGQGTRPKKLEHPRVLKEEPARPLEGHLDKASGETSPVGSVILAQESQEGTGHANTPGAFW